MFNYYPNPFIRRSRWGAQGCGPLAILWLIILGGVLIITARFIVGSSFAQPISTPDPAVNSVTSAVATPEAAVAQQSSYSVTPIPTLFADDFNSGLGPAWEVGFGEWRMVNERLKVISFVNGKAQIFAGDLAWQNYAVDLDAGFFTHDWLVGNDNSVAVYVRSQDRSNNMWFQIAAYGATCGFRHAGEDIIVHRQEGQIGRGDHHLRMEAYGNKYEFLVDGQRICFFEDNMFSSGRVGIWAEQGREENGIWIDNFRVTQLQ